MSRPYWLGLRSALDNFWVQFACLAVIGTAIGLGIALLVRLVVLAVSVGQGLCS